MYKLVALLTRRSGMSTAEFTERYENGHAPLARKLLPEIGVYKRSFVRALGPGAAEGGGYDQAAVDADPGQTLGFDVYVETYFESREACAAMFARIANDPVTRDAIIADEKSLFDRSKTRTFVVEEHESPF